jgi:N-acetylated-alpha-linked acidic dipeptidase
LQSRDPSSLSQLDHQLMRTERALLDPAGLPGRPWYRHVVFAPQFTYAPEVLPAVAEAVRDGDAPRVRTAAKRLADALRRAAAALGTG